MSLIRPFARTCSLVFIAGIAFCATDTSDRLRYHAGTDDTGAPCLNWRGENRCVPKQSAGPQRGHWQRSDLMLPPLRPTDLPAPRTAGAKALVQFCSTCHNLPAPAMHAAQDWTPIISRMRDRMAQAARYGQLRGDLIPNDNDVGTLATYLSKHSLAAVGIHDLPERDSPDSQAFQGYCGACHALPQPAARNAAAWTPVVDRMFRYLAQGEQGRAVEPSGQAAVLRYLKRHGKKDGM